MRAEKKQRELQLRTEEKLREESLRERELQVRAEERQQQEERWHSEMRLMEQELEIQRQRQEAKLAEDSSLIGRTRKYAEVIKHVFPPMPKDSAELPAFFDSVENIFSLYDVPRDLQSKLLVARLTGKAKTVANKLPVADLDDYFRVKQCILNEFRLSPRELRSRFVNATRKPDETNVLFQSRLELSLIHYLRSRSADKDIAKLIDLMVADKLKEYRSPVA